MHSCYAPVAFVSTSSWQILNFPLRHLTASNTGDLGDFVFHTLMDTISWTELSRNTLFFLTFASAQIFRLDVQFSAKEKYTKSLYMPKCLLYLVWFFAVLLVCGLLIEFLVEEFIVFVKQKRENFKLRAGQSFCAIEVFMSTVLGLPIACYIPGLPGRSRTLAGLPHAHRAERPFVSILELSCPLLVHFVVSPRLIILQLCKRR